MWFLKTFSFYQKLYIFFGTIYHVFLKKSPMIIIFFTYRHVFCLQLLICQKCFQNQAVPPATQAVDLWLAVSEEENYIIIEYYNYIKIQDTEVVVVGLGFKWLQNQFSEIFSARCWRPGSPRCIKSHEHDYLYLTLNERITFGKIKNEKLNERNNYNALKFKWNN